MLSIVTFAVGRIV